jgi:hypothetical protein
MSAFKTGDPLTAPATAKEPALKLTTQVAKGAGGRRAAGALKKAPPGASQYIILQHGALDAINQAPLIICHVTRPRTCLW